MRGRRGRQTTEGNADWRVVRDVLPYLWPKGETSTKGRVVAALLFLVLAKLATIITPFFFKYAVDALSGQAPETLLIVLPSSLILCYGAARIAQVLFAQFRDAVFARVGQRALRKLALRSFAHVHNLSLRFHLERKTGAMSRIIERGIKGVEFLLRFLLFSIFPLIIELVLVAAVFLSHFGGVFLLTVVAVCVIYVIFTIRITQWRLAIRKVMNDQDTDANQKAVDALLNYETVKYFSAEARETERYNTAMRGYENAAVRTQTTLALLNIGQTVIISTGLIAVMILAARGVESGRYTIGDLVMANALMLQVMQPLNFLGFVYREIWQSLIDMGDMFGLLAQPAEVTDRPGAQALTVSEGRIRFEDVRFAYEPERQILRGISLDAPGGARIAVIGPSGAGKSTIARLLFRFYDVTGGRILIDGQDIRDVTQASLRRKIGVVPQDTVLFNDTIGYNIAYGDPDAGPEAVREAARSARIHDFIMSLPDGYDTIVGERGLKLSGGEKQRVAIARTILKNPPILILDEATSALDTATEREIQESLRALSRNRTVIMIAHRLSTVVDSDEILVLENGRVVERGRHGSLLRLDGLYARMWARQEGEFDLVP